MLRPQKHVQLLRRVQILQGIQLFSARLCLFSLLLALPTSQALAQVVDTSAQPAPPATIETPTRTETPAAALPTTEITTTEIKVDTTRPIFLWKCNKDGKTVYLLGTIHVARPGFYPLPEEMEKALSESKTLFVEADALQASPEKTAETLKHLGLYTPPATLSQDLSATTRDALNQYLDWSGESLSMYQPYKPWVVGQLLTGEATRKAGYKADLGIDRHLLQEAHAASKKIVPLESVESQLGLISSFDKSTQEKILLGDIISLRDSRSQLEKLENYWKNGDAEALSAFGLNGEGKREAALESAREAILDKRNQSMLEVLQKNLPDQGAVMVAVGAAHLGGKEGLIAKLAGQGFTVEQVRSAGKKKNETISFGGSNLKRQYYPEGMFRVSLPGDPEMKYETLGAIRMVDYAYATFAGVLNVSYIILPTVLNDSTRQNAFMQTIAGSIIKKIQGTNASIVPLAGGAYPSMTVSCKLPTKGGLTKQDLYFRSRMILSGRRLYLIGGQGIGDFFKSKQFAQFDSSLEIVPESGYAYTARSGSPSGFHSSYSAIPRTSSPNSLMPRTSVSSPMQSTFPGLRSNGNGSMNFTSDQFHQQARENFERVKRQLQNSR